MLKAASPAARSVIPHPGRPALSLPLLLHSLLFLAGCSAGDTSGGALVPSDRLGIPDLEHPDPIELQVDRRYRSAPVPFAPSPTWHLSPEGEIRFTEADAYALVRLNAQGDTLLVVTKESDPTLVTQEEMDEAMAELAWFTDVGGRIDPGRIPKQKPALKDFLFEDNGRIWVLTSEEEKSPRPGGACLHPPLRRYSRR